MLKGICAFFDKGGTLASGYLAGRLLSSVEIFFHPCDKNYPPPPQSLPVISEGIKNQLLEEGGLDIDKRTRVILSGMGKEVEGPVQKIEFLTQNVFTDLMSSNRKFVEIVDEALTNIEGHPFYTEWRTKGMAIVLRAFDIHSGYNLIPQFERLQDKDLVSIKAILQKSLPPKNIYLTLLKSLLNIPQIPEQQIALSEIITKIAKAENDTTNRRYIIEGAAAMYQVLGYLWPKLLPPEPTPTPQFPPPQPSAGAS